MGGPAHGHGHAGMEGGIAQGHVYVCLGRLAQGDSESSQVHVHSEQHGLDNEEAQEGPKEGAGGLPGISGVDLQADFDNIPTSTSDNFFVDTDSSNPLVAKEAAGLDPTMTNSESITQCPTLPMITTRAIHGNLQLIPWWISPSPSCSHLMSTLT
jgi:hypothetical protein